MELEQLIEAVKTAKDKAELEAFVQTELQIDLDKRKSLETLRAEVLKGLGVEGGNEAESAAAGSGGQPGGIGAQGQHSAELEQELQRLRDENTELRNALLAEQEQTSQLRVKVAEQLEEANALHLRLANPESLQAGDDLALIVPPELDHGEQPEAPDVSGVRLLRNTENGRDFAWSPELAKLPHMKEL